MQACFAGVKRGCARDEPRRCATCYGVFWELHLLRLASHASSPDALQSSSAPHCLRNSGKLMVAYASVNGVALFSQPFNFAQHTATYDGYAIPLQTKKP